MSLNSRSMNFTKFSPQAFQLPLFGPSGRTPPGPDHSPKRPYEDCREKDERGQREDEKNSSHSTTGHDKNSLAVLGFVVLDNCGFAFARGGHFLDFVTHLCRLCTHVLSHRLRITTWGEQALIYLLHNLLQRSG